MSRGALDPYLVKRLLAERGDEPIAQATVVGAWAAAGGDELAKRAVLLTQLDSLRIRRGVVGRLFDDERVLLRWRHSTVAVEGSPEEPDRRACI